jgi:hypothetical protein
MTAEKRLQALFKKKIHQGYVRNAVLSPEPSSQVTGALRPEERCVVLVRDKRQRNLWFTDRRLLRQQGPNVVELFPYEHVERVHWMARENKYQLPKREFFDRLVVDFDGGGVEIDGLDQSYLPVLQFLQFVAKNQIGGE